MEWYQMRKLPTEEERVKPIERTRFNLGQKFDILLKENQKKDFFRGKKQVRVVPNHKNNGIEIILEKLSEKNEIYIFAELINDKICISVKMKDGTVYENLVSYDDLSMFQKDFLVK